jgi:misacylated tRNA(Ala) deacylase
MKSKFTLMKAIFLEDSYQREFDAKVEQAEGECIILDQTAFYPQSGGQPSDTGLLQKDGYAFKVLRAEPPEPVHIIDKVGLKVGEKVHGILDWDRRYRFMRSHTACHILSAVIFKETGAKITGNQIDPSKSRVDFSMDSFDKSKMMQYVDQANRIIKENHRVETRIIPRQSALAMPDLVRLAMGVPDRDEIRVVCVEGVDVQACSGTHVRSTAEVRGLKLIKAENKGKNNRRIYFEQMDGE